MNTIPLKLEKIYEKDILITNICRYPNGDNELLEFDRALRKISANRKKLKDFEMKQ